MTHRLIAQLERIESARHRQRMYELRAAQVITDDFNLTPLLDHTTSFHIMQDCIYDRTQPDNRKHVPRFWITIRLPQHLKDEARTILLEAFPSFEKGYRVDKIAGTAEHALIESWTHKWDPINEPHDDAAYNMIRVEFPRQAVEGEQLTSTCYVERTHIVTNEETETLTVVCRKPN